MLKPQLHTLLEIDDAHMHPFCKKGHAEKNEFSSE